MLCDYGCGQEAKYQMSSGKWCCCESYNSCPAIRKKNSEGIKKSNLKNNRDYKAQYQNISEEKKKNMNWNKNKTFLSLSSVFKLGSDKSNGLIKKYLIYHNLIEYKCKECGIDKWNNKDIKLELHHINGINNDNRIENLCFLCPNCHSQTDNFRGKGNIKCRRLKIINDDEIKNAYNKEGNISKTLKYLKLSHTPGNYKRVKKILNLW